ncbi:MAG: hypothetical protein HKN43_01300 [Rhodothermales bacterium]|nr:hypothetical protein [Rhodothermales bacterium]
MGLSLDLFLTASRDIETTQYRFLSELKVVRQAFSDNVVYPHLGALVSLYDNLKTLLADLDRARGAMPGEISHIDPETLGLAYTNKFLQEDHMGSLEEIITWALPYIQDTIEEGRTIYEFVDKHMVLEEVGIIPAYVEEGYVLVPDRKSKQLHVLQYQLSIFTGKDENYRSLKTTHIRALESGEVVRDPSSIKLQLVSDNKDLPNPATFSFVTDLDFPFESTMLPIAKRKLMRHLYLQQGSA